jgi:uncharacterized membrane protein YhaH (DUF805 family)
MVLGCIATSVACGAVDAAGFYDEKAFSFALKSSGKIALIAFVVFMIPVSWIGLAIQVKRLHDRGDSGWMILYWFIPLFGALYLLVHLGCIKGTTGPNGYGDDPLQAPSGGAGPNG